MVSEVSSPVALIQEAAERLNAFRKLSVSGAGRRSFLRKVLQQIDEADAQKTFSNLIARSVSSPFTFRVPSAFLIKPVGDACNMRCHYCYEVDRLSYNQQKVMSIATFEKIVNDLLQRSEPVDLFFHGGEPLLAGKQFFKEAITIIRQHPQGHHIHLGVQTNGTLIDDEWAQLFAEHHFSVGISLDGDEELNDSNRIFTRKNGTYKAAIAGMYLLRKHNVNAGVITVFTDQTAADTAKADRIFHHYRKIGINLYDVHPALTPKDAAGRSSSCNVSPANYARFMSRFFSLWLEAADTTIQIRFINDFIHNLAGLGTSSCYSSGKCTQIAGVDPDGSVSPCTRPFRNRYVFGNAASMPMDAVFTSAIFQKFEKEEARGRAATLPCAYSKMCGQGGCPHERLNTRTGEQDISGKHIYCTCGSEEREGFPGLFTSMLQQLNSFLK